MADIPPNAVFDPQRSDPMREAARAGGQRAARPDFRHLAKDNVDPGMAQMQGYQRAAEGAARRGPVRTEIEAARVGNDSSANVTALQAKVQELSELAATRREMAVVIARLEAMERKPTEDA